MKREGRKAEKSFFCLGWFCILMPVLSQCPGVSNQAYLFHYGHHHRLTAPRALLESARIHPASPLSLWLRQAEEELLP